jgi:3-demethoxyubiquinol 3-hydroxylase
MPLYNERMPHSESALDTLISAADRALRAVFAPAKASRPMPVPPPKRTAAPGSAPDSAAAPQQELDLGASTGTATQQTATAANAQGTASSSSSADTASDSAAESQADLDRRTARAAALRRESAALMRINHAGEIAAQALYHGQALVARSAKTRELLLKAAREETDHLAWCEARLRELDSRPSLLNPLWYAGSFAIGAAAALLGDRASLGFVVETERQVEGHLDEHIARLPADDDRSRAILETMRTDEIAHGLSAKAAGGAELPAPVRVLMRSTARVMTSTAYWI